uniref:Uncharacterized protein n=1 Tax=virus sp. ctML55 TaxID=2827627 RepID=A0A8S5RHQ7_9VIRU|nr:MAG TPA: hypothetical protein [virus sp. ctML55]DAX00416.1 MAG TPA: hypothetical protein [Bacteriophage sp.]
MTEVLEAIHTLMNGLLVVITTHHTGTQFNIIMLGD